MTDRLIDDRWYREHEQWLRYSSHADAAWKAAHDPHTPRGLVQSLLERHARFALRAHAARDAARKLEPHD
jgi:hypothetical protein